MCGSSCAILSEGKFVTSGFCLFVCCLSNCGTDKQHTNRQKGTCEVDIRYEVRVLENGYYESSSRGAPLRTVALHAMYDTVHRALINRYTHISIKEHGKIELAHKIRRTH